MALSTRLHSEHPLTWTAFAVRSILVALVAFLVLQGGELLEAGWPDALAASVDGARIGAGMFLLLAAFGRPKRAVA